MSKNVKPKLKPTIESPLYNRERAQKIIDAVIADMNERRGLRQEWDAIDEETQDEIRDAWIEIVVKGRR